MKSPEEKLKATIDKSMRNNMRWAQSHVSQSRKDGSWASTQWRERTIADVAALKLVELQAANERANKLSQRAPIQLGVVVMPQRAASIEEWEAEGKALESQGRKVIDTTVGPAALVEPEKP